MGFSYCLSHTILPKDDRTNFAEKERLGLPHLTMADFGHLCRCTRVEMSGHSDLAIFNNGTFSFLVWVET